MTTIATDRERLTAEQAEIRERIKCREQEVERHNKPDRARLDEIADRLDTLAVMDLIGKPNAVQTRYRCVGHNMEQLNDATGTIEKVGRKWLIVNFTPGGRWKFRAKDLLPADKQQSVLIPLEAVSG